MECKYRPVQNRNRPICIRKLALLPTNASVRQNLQHAYLDYDYRAHALNFHQLMCYQCALQVLQGLHSSTAVWQPWGREERRCICCLYSVGVLYFQCISFVCWYTMKCASLCIAMLPSALWLEFLCYYIIFWLNVLFMHCVHVCAHKSYLYSDDNGRFGRR